MTSTENKKGMNPVLEGLLGIGSLVLITVVGFFVFYAFDMLLLDFDPIGKLVTFIAGLF